MAGGGMHDRGGMRDRGGMHGGGHAWQGGMHGTVNERAVRILQDCIFVLEYFLFVVVYDTRKSIEKSILTDHVE